jgi:hypothetical protein
MNRFTCPVAFLLAVLAAASGAAPVMKDELWSPLVPRVEGAREHVVAPDGRETNEGTPASPWDVASTLGGRRAVAPGDVIWLRGGRYVYPVRHSQKGGNGFAVRVGGAEGKPVHLRAWPGERATIDGGLEVTASHVWIWDLEIALADDWRPREPAPQGANTVFDVPTGVLNITGESDVRIINCVSHHNVMGLGFWKPVRNGEMHGCIVYDNGFPGADRPHGPGIYTQNTTGTPRRLTDNIFGGNFSLSIQCYASNIDESVNDFTIEGNIVYAPRKEAGQRNFNLIGGDLSRGMVLRDNLFCGHDVRLGRKAGQVGEGNVSIRAGYDGPTPEKNTRVEDPSKGAPVVRLRPNRYDPRRWHLAVSNGARRDAVEADLSPALKKGDPYRILHPLDFYGAPLAAGVYDGSPISLPLPAIPWTLAAGDPRELGVYVVLKTR